MYLLYLVVSLSLSLQGMELGEWTETEEPRLLERKLATGRVLMRKRELHCRAG